MDTKSVGGKLTKPQILPTQIAVNRIVRRKGKRKKCSLKKGV